MAAITTHRVGNSTIHVNYCTDCTPESKARVIRDMSVAAYSILDNPVARELLAEKYRKEDEEKARLQK